MFSLFSFHKLKKKKKGFRTDFYGTNIIQCLKFMYFINAPGLRSRPEWPKLNIEMDKGLNLFLKGGNFNMITSNSNDSSPNTSLPINHVSNKRRLFLLVLSRRLAKVKNEQESSTVLRNKKIGYKSKSRIINYKRCKKRKAKFKRGFLRQRKKKVKSNREF